MLSEQELLALMADLESDRIERTESVNDMEKFCIAACAFANDFPGHRQPGFLLIGVNNKGNATGIKVGPRRGVATEAEERRLTEKRVSHAHTYDARPCLESSMADLAADLFIN